VSIHGDFCMDWDWEWKRQCIYMCGSGIKVRVVDG